MRRNRAKIMVVEVVLFLCTPPVIAELRLNDGGIHNIDYAVNDYVVVDLGTTVNVLAGASMWELDSLDASIINVSGGWIDYLFSMDNSRANISGGSMDGLIAAGGSLIDISGIGSVNWLIPFEYGVITIHGSDFAVDGTPVGYGELVGFLSGQLTGSLRNGDPINAYFEIYDNGKISLVPEPGALSLLGLGGLALLRKRRTTATLSR